MLKIILFLLSFFLSDIAFADTYPATVSTVYSTAGYLSSSPSASCEAAGSAGYSTGYIRGSGPYYCDVRQDSNYDNILVTYQTSPETSITCPYGGTVSGTTCIDAPPCTTPAVRAATGECKPPPVSCSSTEYDNGGVCADIPNCNIGNVGFGAYFDVVTKACVEGPHDLCVGSNGAAVKVYCGPINDCIPTTTICSNNADAVAVAENNRNIDLSIAREKALDKKLEADYAAEFAAAKAAEKAAALAATQAKLADAKFFSQDSQSTQEQKAQAALDYAQWLKQEAQDKAEAKNAWDAAELAKIKQAAAQAQQTNSLTETRPGNIDTQTNNIADFLSDIKTATLDSITGHGNGTGPGTGVQAGIPLPTDNIISSLTTLNGSVKGVTDAINSKKTPCEINPNSAGCADLETPPTSDVIPTTDVGGLGIGSSLTHTSWGSAGTCPPDRQFHAVDRMISFSYEPVCDYLSMLAPVLISISFLSAGVIVMGGIKD